MPAELGEEQLGSPYAEERYADRPGDRPDLTRLRRGLDRIRRNGPRSTWAGPSAA